MASNEISEMKKARADLADRIGIAGLKEALDEKIQWIRLAFQLSLAFLLCCTIYYTYGIAQERLNVQYIDKFEDIVDSKSIPMPNVTICAEVYINETFVKNSIRIPADIASKYQMATNRSDLWHTLTHFLIRSTRIRTTDPTAKKLFRHLIDADPHLADYATFLRKALPRCYHMLKNCMFDGKPFDCCESAWQIVGDGSVCYQIGIGHDLNSVDKSNKTQLQQTPGPQRGLTFDASINLEDTYSLDEDYPNGFRVFIHPTAVAVLLSPVTASSGTETFVQITADERLQSRNCLDPGHLPKVLNGSYYDTHGYYCIADAVMGAMSLFANCTVPYMHYWPDSSVVCAPDTIMVAEMALQRGAGLWQNAYRMGIKDSRLKEIETTAESVLKNIHCPKHCRYWDYKATSNFSSLESQRPTAGRGHMFSRVHVYYSSFSYRHHEETQAVTWYIAFCRFGFVIGVCVGMSFVSFVQLAYYYGRYAKVKMAERKRRRVGVAPCENL